MCRIRLSGLLRKATGRLLCTTCTQSFALTERAVRSMPHSRLRASPLNRRHAITQWQLARPCEGLPLLPERNSASSQPGSVDKPASLQLGPPDTGDKLQSILLSRSKLVGHLARSATFACDRVQFVGLPPPSSTTRVRMGLIPTLEQGRSFRPGAYPGWDPSSGKFPNVVSACD